MARTVIGRFTLGADGALSRHHRALLVQTYGVPPRTADTPWFTPDHYTGRCVTDNGSNCSSSPCGFVATHLVSDAYHLSPRANLLRGLTAQRRAYFSAV